MKKSVDFSKGIRGKHSGLDLKILGSSEQAWAVCVSKKEKNLILFKVYRIETFNGSDEVRVENESGKIAYYPKSSFAPIELPKKTLVLLEKAA